MLASRAAAERLATRRVESMMAMKNGKEENARPSSKNWDGRGKGKDRENKKRSEMLRCVCFGSDSCERYSVPGSVCNPTYLSRYPVLHDPARTANGIGCVLRTTAWIIELRAGTFVARPWNLRGIVLFAYIVFTIT
jgi:hypothetical protein